MKLCGIYKIENQINGMIYIGQSKNIKERWKNHKYSLNSKVSNHHNKTFKKDWNKYGEDEFDFSILEECDSLELNRIESRYIKKYDSCKKGYNIGKLLDYDSLSKEDIIKYKDVVLGVLSKHKDKSSFWIDEVAEVAGIDINDLKVVLYYINELDERKYNTSLESDFWENSIQMRKLDVLQKEIKNVYNRVCL